MGAIGPFSLSGAVARLALLVGGVAATEAVSCEDGGPWPCQEDGCPAPMVKCWNMRNDCNRAFSDVFAKPPDGLGGSAVAQSAHGRIGADRRPR